MAKSKLRREIRRRKKKVNGRKPPESGYAIKKRKRLAKLKELEYEQEND